MKTIKIVLPLLLLFITTVASRAMILFEDSSNYPYADGCIEGQGQWICYYPPTPLLDALVTNNVLLLYSNHQDSVEAPGTNGWTNPNPGGVVYASFQIMVSQLPVSSGAYFCEFHNSYPSGNTNAVGACHVFVDTLGTTVPGTFRLGIANFATEFVGAGAEEPPINYPEDLATDTWYNVVIAWGGLNAPLNQQGAALFVNPSTQDYQNYVNGAEYNENNDTNALSNYVYALDTANLTSQQINVNTTEILFDPGSDEGNEGASNVIAGTAFSDVLITSLPVFGIQPYLFSTNYSGNNDTFYAVASGVDLTYQWYSQNYGKLSDGTIFAHGDSFIGSTSNTLVVTNLAATDTYYCEVKDTYGNTATCSNAFEDVITTPTAPFFTNSPVSLTTNVFTYANFYDKAFGSGPISYQWYFAPTNIPTVYSPLVGSNNDYINLYLADYTTAGSYYVVASNSVNGGSIAFGPTNTLVEIPPVVATLSQLHQLLISFANQPGNPLNADPGTTYYLNAGGSSGTPVTVGGYVTTYGIPVPGATNDGGLGNTYAEYYIQDTNGFGAQIYGGGQNDTNQPPIGTYVVVSGLVEVYHCELEIAPSSAAAIVVSNAPPFNITPVLANAEFGQLATNMLGTNALLTAESLVTFTNVYFYSSRLGAPITSGGYNDSGYFYSNSYTTFYFTANGPYNPTNASGLPTNPAFPVNTNMLEVYQFEYDYPDNEPRLVINPFDYQPIPTNCYQLTGAYLAYESTANVPGPELQPSRLADYVVNPPPPFTNSVAVSNSVPTISWTPNVGSTYSVYSSTNLLGPWTQAAYGLTYYPTNGAFTDPLPPAHAKFYYITSP